MKKELKELVTRADELLKAGTPMIVYDFETTGLSVDTDRALSFSAIKVIYKNGVFYEKDRRDIFINPGFHIPEAASNVNGITDETVKDCPYEEDVMDDIAAFLGEKPFLSGYNNTRFDDKFLNRMLQRNLGISLETICNVDVLQLAKDVFPRLTNHKLQTVAHHVGADAGITFHKSIDDVLATFRIFKSVYEKYLHADIEEETLVKIKVTGGNLWTKVDNAGGNIVTKQKRIYFKTTPNVGKVYYDVLNDIWHCDDNLVDIESVKSTAFVLFKVKNTEELIKAVK